MDSSKLKEEIAKIGPWFHNIQLSDNIWTNPEGAGPGSDYPQNRWDLVFPLLPDIKGKSCLDIGCSSGFFSIKMKQLGADKVVGVDYGEQNRAIEQAKFAVAALELDIDFYNLSVYDIDNLGTTFDLILFLGVFYHLRHPLLSLEKLRSICKGTLIIQTVTSQHNGSVIELKNLDHLNLRSREINLRNFPSLKFIENTIDNDESNWFLPNAEAVLAMLRSCGFKIDNYILPNDAEIIVKCS